MKNNRLFVTMIMLMSFVISMASGINNADMEVKKEIERTADSGQIKSQRKFAYSGYSGGMMVHTGYLSSGTYSLNGAGNGLDATDLRNSGLTFGLGGALRVNFGKHFRVGIEGYGSTLSGKNEGYSSVGWGGLLFDWHWEFDKWSVFIGGSVGGGVAENLVLLDDAPVDWEIEDSSVSYREYGFVAFNPFIGGEYALTKRVHLIFRADYLMNVSNRQDDYVNGPRIFFGFMFCH